MRYEIDIFHYIGVYKRHWKRMIFMTILVMFITAIVVSIQPTTYRSTLIALSGKESSQSGNIGKLFGLSGGSSSDQIIFAILKSRRMRNDIDEYFKLKDKPRFWWGLDTYEVMGGFAIEVIGSDSELTRDIANFAAKNVDEVNDELDMYAELGIVKVLDPALKGTPIRRVVSKKVIANGLFVFLFYTLFVFFKEYFSQLKRTTETRKDGDTEKRT